MQTHTVPQERGEPRRPLRVLIADDEPMILRALTRLLERRGHQVHAVGDAYQALELLEHHTFDAVLVDAQMPGDGSTVLHTLERSGFQGTAVLMTGALAADAKEISDGVRRLQKPFRFQSVIPLLEGSSPN